MHDACMHILRAVDAKFRHMHINSLSRNFGTVLSLNGFHEEAIVFKSHLNREKSKSIRHGKHYLLRFLLEFFKINPPIQVVVELHEHGLVHTCEFVGVTLHVDAEVGLEHPQPLQLLQHLRVREKTVLVGVQLGEEVAHADVEGFLVLHESYDGCTV